MKDLGYFSAVFTLLMLPTLVVQRVLSMVSLPILSEAFSGEESKKRVVRLVILASVCASLGITVGVGLLGDYLFIVVFGEKFLPALAFMPYILLAFSIRVLRCAPSSIAIANGDTKTQMHTNFIRVCAVLISLSVAAIGGDIYSILICAIAGELAATIYAYYTTKESWTEFFTITQVAMGAATFSTITALGVL
ncbi:hypothetical protein GCM10022278_19590 [Allohahella marinimesophila]|uniref:Polysaccharide biosynthesis protein n=2 Tax=Allohahella marinimesophila TaxID=1054972 RepID=A0ABP7P8X1_9GAMM